MNHCKEWSSERPDRDVWSFAGYGEPFYEYFYCNGGWEINNREWEYCLFFIKREFYIKNFLTFGKEKYIVCVAVIS